MALPDADMTSCSEKRRCLSGPNKGKAYDPNNPCRGQGTFDPSKCDCQSMVGTWYFVGTIERDGIFQFAESGNLVVTDPGAVIGVGFRAIDTSARTTIAPYFSEMGQLNAVATQTVNDCTAFSGQVTSLWQAGVRLSDGTINSSSITCGGSMCYALGCPSGVGKTITLTGTWTKIA